MYLQAKGLKLLEKNYATKSGEIDLIMLDGNKTVFIEVRFRKRTDFGLPEETVTFQKQRKIVKAAQQYLLAKGLIHVSECRFDIVAIHGTIANQTINWITDAFHAQS